MTEAMDI